MNDRERIVNRDLDLLDEAHYGGRIARAEYRARRRNVLSALRDSHGVTARNVLVPPVHGTAGGSVPGDDVLPTLFGSGARSSRLWLIVFATGALACALMLVLLFLFA
ncbi:hypothetical protein [Frateuria sp. STR12]|uniref:hypothetical protein n=1 Tax=Frateuria hangzhouensis TaxID=2995589 RepID=UPI002260A0BC|nr:hypothetical protein [Frateuria sp. STR12]MCX7514347.1 hypothetical protein [Frateuria sp. STR12]